MGAKGGAVRQQRYRHVMGFRAAGFNNVETAKAMGLSVSHVRSLISDPDGSKVRARKASYAGVCERCGKPTDGSNGREKAPRLCFEHSTEKQHMERHWTQERVLAGIGRLARDVAPRRPVAEDVLKALPLGEDGHALYPPFSAIVREFGTWGNAMVAAGFDRPTVGVRTPEGQARVTAAVRRVKA